MEKIKAKLPDRYVSNAKNYGNEKELVSRWLGIGPVDGKLQSIVDIRCWMGKSNSAQTVYASIWVHCRDRFYSGKGSAGGYGYHKESAAVDNAIRSAGIELSQSIHGGGESAIKEAIEAIGCALKVRVTVFR